MSITKQIADLITWSRLVMGCAFIWLGVYYGAAGLPWATWLLIAAWTGDILDGPLARNSLPRVRTWIGEHDLEVDMSVAGGLLLYMTESEFVEPRITGGYLLIWIAVLGRFGIQHALGMLFQAPIYGWFLWIGLTDPSRLGWWPTAWILIAIVVTWPSFPQEIVPGFLKGMQEVWRSRNQR